LDNVCVLHKNREQRGHQNTKTDEECRMRIRECSKPLQKHNVAFSGGVRHHERCSHISRCGLPINETRLLFSGRLVEQQRQRCSYNTGPSSEQIANISWSLGRPKQTPRQTGTHPEILGVLSKPRHRKMDT